MPRVIRMQLCVTEGVFGLILGGLGCPAATATGMPGQCGSAAGIPAPVEPTSNLCAAGTPSPVRGTGPWTWTCIGVNSAPAATCMAPRQPATTTLYVAVGGSDLAGDGTSTNPFATITKAATRASGLTDIVVGAGTYSPTIANPIVVTNSVAPSYIRVYQDPNSIEKATIDGSHLYCDGSDPACVPKSLVSLGSYIEFRGFELRNVPISYPSTCKAWSCGKYGILAWCQNHDFIIDNTIHDISGAGMLFGCATGPQSTLGTSGNGHLIKGNTVYNTSLMNAPPFTPKNTAPIEGVHQSFHGMDCGSSGMGCRFWNPAIDLNWTVGAIVEQNILYDNYGEGIGAYTTLNTVVTGNTIRNSYSIDIYVDNDTGEIVNNNLVYDEGMYEEYSHFTESAIQLARECYSYSDGGGKHWVDFFPLKDIRIFNNIIIGRQFGISYLPYGLAGGLQNILIANNTIVDQSRNSTTTTPRALIISFYSHNNCDGTVVADNDTFSGTISNNIFYNPSGAAPVRVDNGVSGINFGNNLWYDFTPVAGTIGAGPGDVYADPLFVAPPSALCWQDNAKCVPGDFIPGHYRLLRSSPAIAAGATETDVPVDFCWSSRTVPYSIGAYQNSWSHSRAKREPGVCAGSR